MSKDSGIQPLTGRMALAMRILLVLEIGIFLIGLILLRAAGNSLGTAIVIMLCIYLGSRAIAVGNNFLQTWRARSPRPPEHQIGLAGTLRLLLGEFHATVISYSFLFPFEARLISLAPEPLQPGAATPIVLVPGFCCNRGYWGAMSRHLSRLGYGPIYTVTLEPLLGSMQDNAEHLSRYVEAICEHCQAEKVILVGHSMGGVVARVYVHELGGQARVAKIITLGSPHKGTIIAHMLARFGENLQQMCYQNPWITEFNKNQQKPSPVPITSILTPHDNIVAPQHSAVLHYPNAKNIYLPGVGHLEMPISKPVMETVAQEVEGV